MAHCRLYLGDNLMLPYSGDNPWTNMSLNCRSSLGSPIASTAARLITAYAKWSFGPCRECMAVAASFALLARMGSSMTLRHWSTYLSRRTFHLRTLDKTTPRTTCLYLISRAAPASARQLCSVLQVARIKPNTLLLSSSLLTAYYCLASYLR